MINLYKRVFLKKCFNFFAIIFAINFFNYKGNNYLINKIFNFANKNYQKNTVEFIFLNYFKGNNSAKKIVLNIEKRINYSDSKYKNNIKYIINRNTFT